MKRVNVNKTGLFRGRSQLPFILIFLAIAAAALTLVFVFVRKESSCTVNAPVYQYYSFQRVDYDSGLTLSLGKRGDVRLTDADGESQSDDSPLYYADRTAFILPGDMCWLEPDTGIERSIPALSEIYADEQGEFWCSSGKKASRLSGGFLFSASGTFLFLDSVTLTVDGTDYALVPLSFYSTTDGALRIFNYTDKSLTVLDTAAYEAEIRSATEYRLDLVACIYTDTDGVNKLLAARPSILPGIWD